MVTVLGECAKNMIKKMNLFAILQFIWIVEFYFLAFWATKNFFVIKLENKLLNHM